MSLRKIALVALVLSFFLATASLYAAALPPQPLPHFTISGITDLVRQHGQTEVVGDLTLTADTTGYFPSNSSFLVVFTTTGGNVNISNITPTGTGTAVASGVTSPARVAYVQSETNTFGHSNITINSIAVFGVQKNVLSVNVANTDGADLIQPGEIIRVEGIRLDVGDSVIGSLPDVTSLGAGTPAIVATVIANPPSSFVIDNINNFTVAECLAEMSVKVTPAASLLTCLGTSQTGNVQVSELFGAAFTTFTDENDPSRTPTGASPATGVIDVATQSVTLTINFTGVPIGIKITPAGYTPSGPLTFSGPVPSGSFTGSSGSNSVSYTYTLTGDNILTIDSVTFNFTFAPTSSVVTPVAPPPGNQWFANVTLGPNTYPGTGAILSFIPVTRHVPPDLIGSINTCVTNLLCKFVSTQTGFDTGIAIANTSKDVFTGSLATLPQTGACRTTFFGTGQSTTNPFTISSVTPGTDSTFLVSAAAGNGFVGYAWIQCDFQYAHAEVIVSDKNFATWAHGYDCLVVPDVNVTGIGRSASPHGNGNTNSGEALMQ